MPTTPRGYPLLTADQQYALVSDYNKLAVKADAEATVTEARAQEVATAAKVYARSAADAAERIARDALAKVEPVRALVDSANTKAESALSTAEAAYAYNQALVGVPTDIVNAVVSDPATAAGALVASKVDRGTLMVDSADHPDLQTALNAARAGQTVIARKGDYLVSATLTVPAGVTLSLEDGARIAPSAEIYQLVSLSAGSSIVASSVHGARIHSRGMVTGRIVNTANVSGASLRRVLVEDTTDVGAPAFRALFAIRQAGTTDFTLEDVRLTGAVQGICFYDTNSGVTLRRVSVDAWIRRAVYFAGHYARGATTNAVLEEVSVTDMRQGDPLGDANGVRYPIRFESAADASGNRINHKDVTIRRCTVIGNDAAHVGTTQADGTILYGTADAISLVQIDGLTCEDNYTYGSGDMGLTISGATRVRVDKHHSVHPATAGLALGTTQGGVGGVTDVDVRGLVVEDPAWGLDPDRQQQAAGAVRLHLCKNVRISGKLKTTGTDPATGQYSAGFIYMLGSEDVDLDVSIDGNISDKPIRYDTATPTTRVRTNVLETVSMSMGSSFSTAPALSFKAYRQGGVVTINGHYQAVVGATTGAQIATLPAGWRPVEPLNFTASSRNAPAIHSVRIRTDGAVLVYSGSDLGTASMDVAGSYVVGLA